MTTGAPLDYSHRFHAGNHADVWKHVVLLGWIDAVIRNGEAPELFETHGGEGQYALGPTGEWTEGVGRFERDQGFADPLVRRWWSSVVRLRRGRGYPGSPALVADVLGPGRATVCELQADAAAVLALAVPQVRVVAGDGYAALVSFDPLCPGLVFIDPPYSGKHEWAQAADAVIAAARRRPDLRFLLWYPVKSWSRPNALHARLREAGIAATALDLVVTSLELKRNALAGSGVVLVRPPAGLVGACAAAAAEIGPVCATHGQQWWTRVTAW